MSLKSRLKKITIITLSVILLSEQLFAQAVNNDEDIFSESYTDLITVTALGLTGSILGLSTLSFYEEPWDNTKNILYGLSIGIIIGVAVVAFKHANKSQTYYFEKVTNLRSFPKHEAIKFDTFQRALWHRQNVVAHQPEKMNLSVLTFQTTF